jgi:hypothetical protein
MGFTKTTIYFLPDELTFGTALRLEMKREIVARRDPGRPYKHLEGPL